MTRITTWVLFALLASAGNANGQTWVYEHLRESRGDSAVSLVDILRAEMEKELGQPAPEFEFVPIGSRDFWSLERFPGEPTIVMFWKTNCSGCRMQISELGKLYKKFEDDGLNVIYISPQSESTIQEFMTENEFRGMVARTSSDNLERPYQLFATPSTFLVDRSGHVRDAWLGPKMFDALEEIALPYVAEQ